MLDVSPAFRAVDCETRFDSLTRQLYATDASIYRIEPAAVAFPRDPNQASSVVRAAAQAGLSVTPRGAGSGLVGGAIGEGLVIDFSRFNQRIHELDLQRRTVRVDAGVVLDQLNAHLRPHGLCFGPDVATSSRATVGGMIANNSSGAHTPVYGTTADHVASLKVLRSDGRIEDLSPESDLRSAEWKTLHPLIRSQSREIGTRMPPGLLKRWPGYGIDRFAREPHLANLFAGSEGTLGAILSAELRVVPIPRQKGLGLLFFASVAEAMQATTQLADLKPAAIEHIDRILVDQTRGQLQFRAARDLMDLDARPCGAILMVEFFEEVEERLAALEKRRLGTRSRMVRNAAEMNLVWSLRKAGLALLTGCKGSAKPVTCIEDTAVRPERLPEYVEALQRILGRVGVEACFYGHAASGLLHVRPVLDLHHASDRLKLRQISDEVSAVVRQFGGSLAAEHGVGIARTEYLAEHLGPGLMEITRQVKDAFDPGCLFNPGKILDDGRYRMDTRLRTQPGELTDCGFEPVLRYAAKDGSFSAHLDQCNGCGGCRKAAATMCPTFVATGEELLSTRGRANVIRAALEHRFDSGSLDAPELEEALSQCLSCKACATECPSNVNLALLKAELLHARHQRNGVPIAARWIASVDRVGDLASLSPTLANAALGLRPVRWLLERVFGFSADRQLPRYAEERFDAWFNARGGSRHGARGPVLLWDDCFVRHNEPHIGRAAVAVLEAAGYEVVLPPGRSCCGRPAFSQGMLDQARGLGEHNVELLTSPRWRNVPVIFLEPSCQSMFAEDYRELGIADAEAVAARCLTFEQFVSALLKREPDAISFRGVAQRVVIHGHCHAKALSSPAHMVTLARAIPGAEVSLIDSGCCGMAGAFGVMVPNQQLSAAVARPLIDAIEAQPTGTRVIASGTSCRHQIQHFSRSRPVHMAELLAEALAGRTPTSSRS